VNSSFEAAVSDFFSFSSLSLSSSSSDPEEEADDPVYEETDGDDLYLSRSSLDDLRWLSLRRFPRLCSGLMERLPLLRLSPLSSSSLRLGDLLRVLLRDLDEFDA